MPYQINRPTQRELQERLAKSRQGDSSIRGRVRTLDEAFETAHRLRRETGEEFTTPYAVTGSEAKQSVDALDVRSGRNPETGEPLHSESTRHD